MHSRRYSALKTAHMRILAILLLASSIILIGLSINSYLYLSYDLLIENIANKIPLEINFIFSKIQWVSLLIAAITCYLLYFIADKIIDSVPVWNRLAILICFSIVLAVVYFWLSYFALPPKVLIPALFGSALLVGLLYTLTMWLQDSYMARQASSVKFLKSFFWALAFAFYLALIFRFDFKAIEHEIALWLARNDIFQQSLFGFELKQLIFMGIALTGFILIGLVARATLPIIFSTKSGRYTFICLSALLFINILIIEGNTEQIYSLLSMAVFFAVLYRIIRSPRSHQRIGNAGRWRNHKPDEADLANTIYGIPDGILLKMP